MSVGKALTPITSCSHDGKHVIVWYNHHMSGHFIREAWNMKPPPFTLNNPSFILALILARALASLFCFRKTWKMSIFVNAWANVIILWASQESLIFLRGVLWNDAFKTTDESMTTITWWNPFFFRTIRPW